MPSEGKWGKQESWPPKVENKIINEETLREKLETMSMSQLRSYVKLHKLKAKDTDKSELILEILTEVQ